VAGPGQSSVVDVCDAEDSPGISRFVEILNDVCPEKRFWMDPSICQDWQATRDRRQAATWYIEKRWVPILENLLDRIYFLNHRLDSGGFVKAMPV